MTRRRRLVLAAVAAAVAAVVLHLGYGLGYLWYSMPGANDRNFRSGFESGTLDEWSDLGARQFCCPHSVALANDFVRQGRHAVRIELDRRDPDVRGSKRAEFRLKAVPRGSTYRYAFSVYIPEDWRADPIPVTVAQWHAVPDKVLLEGGRTPPLRVAILGDEWFVVAHSDATRIAPLMLMREQAGKPAFVWRGPIERGQWTDWTITVRWSHGDDGRVAVAMGGVQIADRKGPVGFNDFLAPYFKVGLYVPDWAYAEKAAAVTRRVIYLDDIAAAETSFAGDAAAR